MTNYLPTYDGLLPSSLLLVGIPLFPMFKQVLTTSQTSAFAVFNSIQAYSSLHLTRRMYSGPNSSVTPLSARTFGTWTILAAIIRVFAAYHISDPAWYQLCLLTYAVGIGHFMAEWLIFKTMIWGLPLVSTLAVAGTNLIWMLAQWDSYVI